MEETKGGPVAEDVRRRILAMLGRGEIGPGSRLGSERDLAEAFSVSRSTLRSALLTLAQAGIVERRPGRSGGIFVRAGVVERAAGELSSLPERLLTGGHTSRSQVLATERRPATVVEARSLEIGEREEVLVVRRLRFADGVPLSVDTACLVAQQVPDLLDQPLGGSLYSLLEERYGFRPTTACETIEVVMANPREAQWLQIPRNRPLLAVSRVTRDQRGRPFEYGNDLFRADRVRLVAATNTVLGRESLAADGVVERVVSV
ncbi:GntR family transcriptional regulator [Gordonia sp. N1V]|uniref:GntR family transcriptional regulator n=1 Tax=Gordonia sp. N1V TaxID=3034163 RepID=UPI0023E296F9|nr:GntR family transcriptional regulator [Gordonia sp. N1V]MDF3284637.1 GntR family transcriptional regulator [Gordonia sp. N1V]